MATPSYPSSKFSYVVPVDGITDVLAAFVDQLQVEQEAIIDELGFDVAGTAATLLLRLNQGMMEGDNANTETLAATKTLVDADGTIQILDTSASGRDVELPAEATSNHSFVIYNSGSSVVDLTIKTDAPATLGTVADGEFALVIPDGTQWLFINLSTGALDIDDITPTTTKGDLIVEDGSNAVRLPVGSDGQFLKADSGDAEGIVWGGVTVGKQTIWVGAESMVPETTSGCGLLEQAEGTAGRPEVVGLPFDGATAEYAQFRLAMPKKWNSGTILYQVFWSSTNVGTEGVVWGLSAVAFADSDAIDTAFGTEVQVTDNGLSAGSDQLVSAESGALTIDGSPGNDEMVYFRVSRDPVDGSDTMTEDAILHGIKIIYTTDLENDD